MPEDILVTGGSGFIGTHLTHALLDRGHRVTVFGRGSRFSPTFDWRRDNLTVMVDDLSNTERLQSALPGHAILFHKASFFPTITSSNNADLFQSNISGTQSLIDVMRALKGTVRHLIFDSSISVYGEGCYHCESCGKVRPSLRTQKHTSESGSFEPTCPHCRSKIVPAETAEADSLNGVSPYAMCKKAQEEMLASASQQLGFTLTILRYATVYGPHQRATSPYAQFVEAICRGETVTLNEDGLQKRDFVYIDDVVEANLRAMESPSVEPLTVNIGSGTETTLIDFVSAASDYAQRALKLPPPGVAVTNTLVEGDVRHCKIDCSRAREQLGFQAGIDLRQGLERWLSSRFSARV